MSILNKTILRIVKVKSSSMSPVIRIGEKVLLSKALSYGLGDLVGFHSEKSGGIGLIHRVIKTNADSLITCGDKSRSSDVEIRLSDIYGKVQMIKVGKKWKKVNITGIGLLNCLQSYLIRLSNKYPSRKVFLKSREIVSIISRKIVEKFG